MVVRTRDALRSRTALLAAAEDLFAAVGFHATSLADVAAAAGLSRGAPNYFFGSKEALLVAVLRRLFAEREAATAAAFAPVLAWRGDHRALASALTRATEDYLAFLLERPAFVRLLVYEELDGGGLLAQVPRESRAMSEAFTAVRRRSAHRFAVDDAVLVFVSLTFSPLAQQHTFLRALGRDLSQPRARRAHARLVVAQILALIATPSSARRSGPPRDA